VVQNREIPRTAGLCQQCRWAEPLANTRGSVFVLCGRSRIESEYPKYPRLPVLSCRGCTPRGERVEE